MSEKLFRVRFEQEDGRGEIVNEKGVELTSREVVDLLNKQQSTIEAKDKEIAELDQQCAEFLGDNIKALDEFEECTDKLKAKILEQQATINDLNDELEKSSAFIIEQREENKQLRKELDNFKPIMFQDMRKGTVILYSKGKLFMKS